MVIVRLEGGLGNQLFQYAAGRRLALKTGTSLKLDCGLYAAGSRRPYGLDTLSIRAETATPAEVRSFRGWKGSIPDRLLTRITRRPSWLAPRTFYREASFRFDPTALTLRPPVYLWGYWQSQRYFEDVAEQVRSELVPREVRPGVASLRSRMEERNSASVHVRRGDYVHSSSASRTHGTCGPEYYARALDQVLRRQPGVEFYVFSDDPAWAREHVALPGQATHVSTLGFAPYEELFLMSSCHHHIIANSTFSWWGAWLNPSREKVVIAPERWFSSSAIDASDVVPSAWSRV